MLAPLIRMRFKFMVWLQSESDVCASDDKCEPQRGALYYTCAIKAMISDLRDKFKVNICFLLLTSYLANNDSKRLTVFFFSAGAFWV